MTSEKCGEHCYEERLKSECIECAHEQITQLEAHIKHLVVALDAALGTPCEAIRHEQEMDAARERIAELTARVEAEEYAQEAARVARALIAEVEARLALAERLIAAATALVKRWRILRGETARGAVACDYADQLAAALAEWRDSGGEG